MINLFYNNSKWKRYLRGNWLYIFMNAWHAKEVRNIFSEVRSSEKGLSERDAIKRLAKYGKNELAKEKKTSDILKFLKQLIIKFLLI